MGFDSDLLGKKGIIHLSPNGCQALSSFILIYSYYSFCLEYRNNSETLVGDEMHIGIMEHLIHLSQKEYEYFFPIQDGKMLKSDIFEGKSRRDMLKWKTSGLIYHDRILTQDSRLQDCLKL